MDHREEQLNEIEVLKSIYFDEFEQLNDTDTEPSGSNLRYRILVKSDEHDENDANFSLTMTIEYPPLYPEEVPFFSLDDIENIPDNEVENLRQKIDVQLADDLGTPSVYNSISLAKDFLNDLVTRGVEQIKEEEERRVQAEEEEEERRKHTGTTVTKETFGAWRKKFEIEKRKAEIQVLAAMAERGEKRRPTGKELFQKDKSLGSSDEKYYEAGDTGIDLAGFEKDLERLEIEDEETNEVLKMLKDDRD